MRSSSANARRSGGVLSSFPAIGAMLYQKMECSNSYFEATLRAPALRGTLPDLPASCRGGARMNNPIDLPRAVTGRQKMTPSEAFVETLVSRGVTDVFGIVGSAYMD